MGKRAPPGGLIMAKNNQAFPGKLGCNGQGVGKAGRIGQTDQRRQMRPGVSARFPMEAAKAEQAGVIWWYPWHDFSILRSHPR